ncbi:MAG: hydroxymethylglutaryl-CoA synthase [Bacteroidota bacterium]
MSQVPQPLSVGIDDMSAYIPQLYLPIETLAEARDIPYAKLNKGLGLEAMSVADTREDSATMAANAVLDLIHKNDLDPRKIGRIYLGTESALDGAKPTATYVLEMVQEQLAEMHGADCLLNCDVIDMTFACIGAVDALHNTLDWVGSPSSSSDGGGQASPHRGDKRGERLGIIVASDDAKYELASGGEYTQGAGAIALLIKRNPRLLVMDSTFGVATRPVHDFFKPTRQVSKRQVIEEVLALLPPNCSEGVDLDQLVDRLGENLEVKGILDCNEYELELHKVTPVFDGPYSNECYQSRIREALLDFRRKSGRIAAGEMFDSWSRLIFHLPYAYQARRMFAEIYVEELKAKGNWVEFIAKHELEVPCADNYEDREEYLTRCGQFLKSVSKTSDYKAFVEEKVAPGEWASSQVGNMYAGSIWLSLMSALEDGLGDGNPLKEGNELGFFAYGSGSKSKVFSATLADGWAEVVADFGLARRLDLRQSLSYETYEALHRGRLKDNVAHQNAGTFFLADIHREKGEMEGARHYGYRAEEVVVG